MGKLLLSELGLPSLALFDPCTTVWATLPHLPVELHNPEIILTLGNSIGKVIAFGTNKVDLSTHKKICIEIHLTKTLPSVVLFNEFSKLLFSKISIFLTLFSKLRQKTDPVTFFHLSCLLHHPNPYHILLLTAGYYPLQIPQRILTP